MQNSVTVKMAKIPDLDGITKSNASQYIDGMVNCSFKKLPSIIDYHGKRKAEEVKCVVNVISK